MVLFDSALHSPGRAFERHIAGAEEVTEAAECPDVNGWIFFGFEVFLVGLGGAEVDVILIDVLFLL